MFLRMMHARDRDERHLETSTVDLEMVLSLIEGVIRRTLLETGGRTGAIERA